MNTKQKTALKSIEYSLIIATGMSVGIHLTGQDEMVFVPLGFLIIAVISLMFFVWHKDYQSTKH